jgi:HAE1 family hydrophobic/amphiphilic exporter-1
MLKWSMAHRWVVVLVCLGVLGSIPTLWNMLPYNFLPEEDESQFQISLETPRGTSLAETARMARQIDAMVRKVPEAKYTLLTVGGRGFGPGSSNEANIFVGLKPVEDRKEAQADIIQRVRRQLRRATGRMPIEARVSPVNSFNIIGGRGGWRAHSVCDDWPRPRRLAGSRRPGCQKIKEVPGVSDADTSLQLGQPEVNVDIDRDLAGELGVRPSALASALRYLVGGQQVTTFTEGGEQYEVHMRADPDSAPMKPASAC